MRFASSLWAWLAGATCVACSSSSSTQTTPPAPTTAAAANDAGPQHSPDSAPSSPPSSSPPLTWAACDTTDWPAGYDPPVAGVECTTIDVPLHHDHPEDGKTFALRVARQKSRAYPTGKAAFQIAGGPGGASVWQTGEISGYLPKLLDQFDLVFVDQRGTGGSGYLDCSKGYPQSKQDWIACAAEHTTEELDRYLSVDAAHDLDSVRERLGYDKISLRGGSYGTRVGLEYLRQHGDRVVAAVLDGLVPTDLDLLGESIGTFDRGVTRIVGDCAASASCKAITPDLGAELTQRRATLKQTPRPILVDGQAASEDESAFLYALFNGLFSADSYFPLPRAVHGADTGDFTVWDKYLGQVFGGVVSEPKKITVGAPVRRSRRPGPRFGKSYVSPGTWFANMCAEYVPNGAGFDAWKAATAQQVWGNQYDDEFEACSAWNVHPIAASLRAPVVSDAKVLLLNGDLDLNTFPEWGAHAAKTLSNGTNLVIPYATHATMIVPCVGDVIGQFLGSDGDMTKVDASCIKALSAPPW